MDTDRRTLLKSLAAAGAAMTVVSAPAEARERRKVQPDAVGLLYDSTMCVGCKACVVACKDANGMPADVDGYGGGLYDAPEGLNEYTRNVIQLHREGNEHAFVKKQCMHCVDPGCVSACMLGALHKEEKGIVSWDSSRCVGCRYCQVACPFGVPQYEFASNNPKIVKCELCRHRLAKGQEPACSEVCPRKAVIYGKYADLLDEAHRRLLEKPDLYVPKVYGERDLGGTQALYLSAVPFEKLGFRFQEETPIPETQQTVQESVYRGFIAPLALYAMLGATMFRNRKSTGIGRPEKQDEQD